MPKTVRPKMGASVNQMTETRARLTTACTDELNTSGRVFAYAEIWGYSQMLAICLLCCAVLCSVCVLVISG